MNLFIDAYVGLLDGDDPHHAAAVSALKCLESSRLISSSLVLSEVATRGARLAGVPTTARFLRGVWEREAPHLVFLVGLRIQEKCEDQDLSLADAISVVLMRTAWIFDRAFRRLGFRGIP